MSQFHKIFGEKVKKVWNLAHQLNKPIDNNLPWTFGIIKGRSDFEDLQVHGAALISSIIINEPVVPKIICAWDLPIDPNTTKWDYQTRCSIYPIYLLSLFENFSMDFLKKENIFSCYEMNTKYVEMHRSGFSVNSIPTGLALGYRAKYLGLNYVMNSHAIMSDIDTICTKPCIKYLKTQIEKDPNTFCLTNWYNETDVSVGLVVFNMEKYRNVFFPILCNESWNIPKGDSRYIPIILERYPELEKVLDIKTYDINFHAEKFHVCKKRGNIWDDEKTFNYHAWKGDIRANPTEFFKNYNQILDSLFVSGRKQLEEQNKK